MKIAFFTDVFLPSVNGVVTVVETSARGFADRGHEVAIFYPESTRGERTNWKYPHVTLFPIASLPSLFYPDIRIAAPTPKPLMQLKRFAPDIIHIQAPGPVGLEGLIGGKFLKIPLVSSFHTYFMEPEYLKIVNLSRFGSLNKALWSVTVAFYNRCDMVFIHSPYMARDLTNHGLHKSKLRFTPNALDFSALTSVTEQTIDTFKKRYSLGDQVIMYVGRVSREKNLEVLIEAFAKVAHDLPHAQLLMVGDGPVRSDLEELVESLGIGKQVVFTGSIPHKKLVIAGAYQAATLFCTPSTTETQCMSVLEAMAAAKPIVGMKAMGMIDMVDKNGVLVTPGDVSALAKALAALLTDKKRLSEAGAHSEVLARRHSIPNVMAVHEKLYQELIA